MKKILFLLAAGSFFFHSCDTTQPPNNPEDERAYWGTQMSDAATGQLGLVLDPFNLTFRLNVLMTECGKAGLDITDVNHADVATVRSLLFGSTSIAYDDSEQAFTLTLSSGATGDFTRSGKLYIHTYGQLLKDGASWSLSMTEDNNYVFSSAGGSLVSLSALSYYCTANAENTWTIHTNQVMTKTTVSGEDYEAEWGGTFIVTQDEYPGDQGFDKISKSTYSCVVQSNSGVEALTSPGDKYEMLTTEGNPLRFNAACGGPLIVGGELKIIFSEYIAEYPMSYTICSWGKETDCDAEGSAIYFGL